MPKTITSMVSVAHLSGSGRGESLDTRSSNDDVLYMHLIRRDAGRKRQVVLSLCCERRKQLHFFFMRDWIVTT